MMANLFNVARSTCPNVLQIAGLLEYTDIAECTRSVTQK